MKNNRTERIYIGYTKDIERRLVEHKKKDVDIELVYYEAYNNGKQAQLRERRLKLYGSAWRGLERRLGL
ncbi:MAG: GIY-YIG nuclease family protein [Thermoplasmatales archaeon]|nr:GIY-YIG nuclease family protein [Thermoplasmatales archaeon]